MTDSDFWRDLADKFKHLEDPSGSLQAKWTPVKSGIFENDIWGIFGGTKQTRRQFESLAAIGGRKFDPRARDPLKAWLETVRREYPARCYSLEVHELPDGRDVQPLGGSIHHVRDASADCCTLFAHRAIQDEPVKHIELSPAIPAPSNPAPMPESTGEQLDDLREESRWTQEQLAGATGFDPTTVSRHIRDEMSPSIRNLGTYERVFSKRLNRKIVVRKTPSKRH